jgi:hypothetical protein
MNATLDSVAASDPGQVKVLDIDKIVSPDDRYNDRVDGQLCRFDGIHFTAFCSRLLQADVLSTVRAMIRPTASSG